jgi:catechol 2,3-dioxygenase-like lactoylglutathione lyase family enzyme
VVSDAALIFAEKAKSIDRVWSGGNLMNPRGEPGTAGLGLCQVALNTTSVSGTLRLYSELFGFSDAGGHASWGKVARVQGLQPDAHWLTWWMVGAQSFFQLELFHHDQPRQKPLPEDWRPSDHGWVRFGIAVDDFDRVVAGLARWSIPLLGTTQVKGQRRLAFRDPHVGIVVEILEGAATTCPAVIYATSSASDIARTRQLYENVLGLEIKPLDLLHSPENEKLWGLAGAKREGFLVCLGDSFLEVLSYSNPMGRPRPADHSIVDQGIMNVGLGSRDAAVIRALIARVQQAGVKITVAVSIGDVAGTYIVEPDFEIELLGMPAHLDKVCGFVPIAPSFAAALE